MRFISHCERVRSTSAAIYVLGFWIATNHLAMKGLQAKLAMTIGTIIPHPPTCHTERSEVSKKAICKARLFVWILFYAFFGYFGLRPQYDKENYRMIRNTLLSMTESKES